jgi:hypothetical protein
MVKLVEKDHSDPDMYSCDWIMDVEREDINKIIWMYLSGIAIVAISNYFRRSVREINSIIDVYSSAFI